MNKKLIILLLPFLTSCATYDKLALARAEIEGVVVEYKDAEPYYQHEYLWPALVNISSKLEELERRK